MHHHDIPCDGHRIERAVCFDWGEREIGWIHRLDRIDTLIDRYIYR